MATKKTVEKVFNKKQILASEAFSHRKDILAVLIADEEEISISEVENRLENFMKGTVN